VIEMVAASSPWTSGIGRGSSASIATPRLSTQASVRHAHARPWSSAAITRQLSRSKRSGASSFGAAGGPSGSGS